MKKKVLLILTLLCLTGCNKVNTNTKEYVNNLNNVFKTNNTIVNKASIGYKYYLPQGVTVSEDSDFNQTFNYNGTKMYLYVDLVSYYYKKVLDQEVDYNFYFSNLNYGKKYGYILINEENNKYFVKIVYNYAKIELYTDYKNLNNTIIMASIILNSIDYNDTIISGLIDDEMISYSDITYQLGVPDSNDSFSKYLEEYIQEEQAVELPEE